VRQRKTCGVPVRLDDLLREGAGTVWGNLAPRGCSLSAPAIAVWTDASARPAAGEVWGSAVFECALELLYVQVRGDAVAAPAGSAP
jgi:hypothetical protein